MVAPLAGARIEIQRMKAQKGDHYVAPLAGARIEIPYLVTGIDVAGSLPSRERGLKYRRYF